MKSLILVRHAKSSWNHSDLRDFDRPLNDRGERDAPEMARRLAGRNLPIDRLVSSPAVRALTTARIFGEALGLDGEAFQTDPAIYEAGPDQLLQVIHSLPPEARCAVLVGHNPGLTFMVNALADADLDNLPTCGVVSLTLPVASWAEVQFGGGSLLDYDYPKKSSGI